MSSVKEIQSNENSYPVFSSQTKNFGLAGFLLGPLIVSILFTLFDIYFTFVDEIS
jgi:hypothetical protein